MFDVRTYPAQGKQYRIQLGDTVESISSKAYGTSKYTKNIIAANPELSKNKKTVTGQPEVYPGNIIIIPEIRRTLTGRKNLTNKDKDDFTLIVEGMEIPLLSAKAVLTMDTCADGWSGVIAWEPRKNKELDKRLLPYRYPKASVYLGGELIINGLLYTVSPELSESGRIKNLEGASFTADAVDSTIKPPYEKNNINLKQRATELAKQIGVNVFFQEGTSPGGAFDRITASPGDTIFSHLADLASQRGLLLSSTPEGDFLFLKAGKGKSVGTLEEGQLLPLSFSATYDGRRRYNIYKAIGQSPGGDAQTAIAKDENVPRTRIFTFTANDTTPGDIQKAANWKRSKMLADALSMSFPVSSWYAPNGKLWKPNTNATVISETLDLPDGVTLVIRSVEFDYGNSGTSATINLVPKEVYTGEALKDPWSVKW